MHTMGLNKSYHLEVLSVISLINHFADGIQGLACITLQFKAADALSWLSYACKIIFTKFLFVLIFH